MFAIIGAITTIVTTGSARLVARTSSWIWRLALLQPIQQPSMGLLVDRAHIHVLRQLVHLVCSFVRVDAADLLRLRAGGNVTYESNIGVRERSQVATADEFAQSAAALATDPAAGRAKKRRRKRSGCPWARSPWRRRKGRRSVADPTRGQQGRRHSGNSTTPRAIRPRRCRAESTSRPNAWPSASVRAKTSLSRPDCTT